MADTWHYPHLREAFQEFLRKCRKQPVVVVGHARPDADCIGSQAALVRVLREAGGEASALNESQIPFRLEFLTEGIPYRSEAAALPEGALVVTVDCSDTARAGIRLNLQDHQVGANFDHHLSNQEFGDQAFVVKNATSTAELLGGLLRDAGMPINRETATALYAGIITDAGNFCYPSTTPEVLEMAAYLIRQGAQPAQISQAIYERETFAKIRLLKIFLERMTLFADSRACYSWLTEEDFTTTGATYQDTEGLVNHARAIEGVRIAAYLEVKKDQVKGSLRSRDESNRVDLLAGRFGGGGHACAAGFVWSGTLESLLPEFKAALIEFSNPSFYLMVDTQAYEGILLVDKPQTWTSHDVVGKLRRIFQMKRIGHAGTLDPMATGLLICLVGKATKASQYLISLDKEYTGEITLGEETNSQDADGEVVASQPVPVLSEEELKIHLKSFLGDQYQIPPMHSAIKVGVPLYKMARKGETIVREPRFVRVSAYEVTAWDSPRLRFLVRCSKGTYVRTLAHDLGQRIGCGAHLSALRRTATHTFRVEDAVTLEALQQMAPSALRERLLPVRDYLPSAALGG